MNGISKWRQRVGFGCADMASNFVWAMITAYLTIFYTDIVGIAVVAVGTMTLITKIIDAITDIIMGIIVDHTHTKWGKCRPYFLFGAIPFAICAILLFINPPFGPVGKLVYAYITFTLVSTAYTVVNTPLSAILPSLSSDGKERNVLVTFRMVFAAMGSFVVTTFAYPMIDLLGGNDRARGYLYTVIIFAVVAAFLFFVTFKNTREIAGFSSDKHEKIGFKKTLQAFNGQYVLFMVMMFAFLLAFAIKQAGVVYFYTYSVNMVYLIPTQAAVTSAAMIIGQLTIPFVANHIGKRNSVFIMCAIAIVGNFLFSFGEVGGVPILLVATFISWFALGFMMGMRFSLLADVIDYSEYKSGVKASGMLASVDSFIAKLTFGLNVTIFTALMALGGYIPNKLQSRKEIFCINIGFIWIPIVCCGIVILLMLFFKVEKQMPQIEKELNKRRDHSAPSPSVQELEEAKA